MKENDDEGARSALRAILLLLFYGRDTSGKRPFFKQDILL